MNEARAGVNVKSRPSPSLPMWVSGVLFVAYFTLGPIKTLLGV